MLLHPVEERFLANSGILRELLWPGDLVLFDELKRSDAVPPIRCFSRTARCVFACVLSAIFLLATLGAGAAETKQVLMLHSFGREVKPWSEYARTIRAELDRQSPWPLEITEHSLLTARSSDENPDVPCPPCQTPARPDCDSRRACGRLCPAPPATALCHHPHGVHGSGTASRSVFHSYCE